jgi:hypothetical protein
MADQDGAIGMEILGGETMTEYFEGVGELEGLQRGEMLMPDFRASLHDLQRQVMYGQFRNFGMFSRREPMFERIDGPQYRQGDVLLRPIKVTKRGRAETVKTERHVLAEGEKTGHVHVMENVRVADLFGTNVVVADVPTDLVHDEHKTITVDPGAYEVVQQREYDPDDQQVSRAMFD